MISAPSQPTPRICRLSSGDFTLLETLTTTNGIRNRLAPTGRFLTMHKRRRKKLTTRSLSQENPAILDDIMHGQVQCILDHCGRWAFNAFALETAAGGRSLPVLCVHLFHWYGLLEYFQLDVVRVWKLFTLIEEGYHSTNPYHNSIHATDVTQAMHCFLQEEKIKKHMNPVEVMASLIGAVAHDLDHPGVNQPFLIATSNHLAALYDNSSVLENHHWRSAVGCLLESGVAEQLNPWRESLESQIRSLILATDITRQQEFLNKLKHDLDSNSLDMSREEDRHFILQIALKCADISNPTRPWDISRKWSLKVCEEFFRQGDFERKLNLPVTSLCDRHSTSVPKIQTGFFRFVVTPLFAEWHRFLDSELSHHMMEILESNQRRWEALEAAENAEETRTELSDAEGERDISDVSSERGSSERLIPSDFIPKREPLSETKTNRRHSVPVSISRPLHTRIGIRRESLPPVAHKSPVEITQQRAHSKILSDPSEILYSSQTSLMSGGSTSGRKNSSSLGVSEKDERPLSAEELLPETSITSITAVGLSTTGSRCLTRQQTFPPLQPYVRVRYLSTTAEMSSCKEALLEGGSHSNSSHNSQENVDCINPWNQTIPTVILSPNNNRGSEMYIPELQCKPSIAQAQIGIKRTDINDWEDIENTPKIPKMSESVLQGQKENLDPKKLINDLAKRRGSAPVTSHIKFEDNNQSSIALRTDIIFSRRGSMPAEIIRQKSNEVELENRTEFVRNKIPTSQSEPLYYQYPRRGSVPTDIPLVRTDILTRHSVSLNGKAGRRKKQLRRRSSGGPETVCLIPDIADNAAWHRIRREIVRRSSDFNNPDITLTKRRGSLPIEVLTVGHSGNRKRVIFK